jgi:hypothetical protein
MTTRVTITVGTDSPHSVLIWVPAHGMPDLFCKACGIVVQPGASHDEYLFEGKELTLCEFKAGTTL